MKNVITCSSVCMCVFPSASCVCVCVWLTHVSLWKCLKEGNIVFTGLKRLFGCLTFTFIFYGDYCVWRSLLAALKSYSSNIHLFVLSLLKNYRRVSRQSFEEEAFVLLGDNVITWQSRKCEPPVWAVNGSATMLSLCSHTTLSTQDFGCWTFILLDHAHITRKNLILTFRQ